MIRPEDIRDLLKKQPFQPFRMHMSLAFVTRGTIVVSKPVPGSEEPIGEGVHLVSVLHINNIELLPSSAAPKKG